MENTITLLDYHTINQIAAGEVIESPADVIKELIENSLDARATMIYITIKNGGLDKIKIIDNGYGIPKENIKKAFMRHGTSKLTTIDDLYKLDTMGFRGEALASIASISEVILSSKITGESEGYVYCMKGGEDCYIHPIALTEGTHIVIKNLFYNAPVRQKFLSSLIREKRKSIITVEKLAMSRPDVSFELISDGRVVLKTLGNGSLKEVASIVFSLGTAEKMEYIFAEEGSAMISGLIGARDQYRGSRDFQYFFINRRCVKSKGLSQALERAYKNILPQKKYPIGIIHLNLPIYEVEVNIHPRKLEVKIEGQELIETFLEDTIKKSLYKKEKELCKKIVSYKTKEFIENKDKIALKEKAVKKREKEEIGKEKSLIKEQITLTVSGKVKIFEEKNLFKEVRIVGNISNAYLIGILEDNLYLFDQHACHERISFERIKKQFLEDGFKSQFLLKPELIEVSQSDYLKIVEHIISLEGYGVLLEAFGENSFILRGLPLSMPGEETGIDFLLELVDKIENKELEMIEDFMITKAACVGSIKAGDVLTKFENKSLLFQLGQCEFPYTCPHGRPTVIKWSIDDLGKLFLRS